MSKNISIQEGGQGKAFGRIQKLKIAQSGGGDTLWVPEEEVRTKSLYVSKNGTYLASSESVYGYDEVDVNITNGVTYTDDDVDYYIGVDDDGYLEEPEEMPMYIEITVPADRLIFIDGETIDTKGMQVTAYYADGTAYGVLDDWMIEPKKADKSKSSGHGELVSTSVQWLEDYMPLKLGGNGQTIYTDAGTFYDQFKAIASDGVKSVTLTRQSSSSGTSFCLIFASAHEGKYGTSYSHNPQPSLNSDLEPYTYDGKTVYYIKTEWGMQGNITYNEFPLNRTDLSTFPSDNWHMKLAWEMIYGNIKEEFMQTIKVMWAREDGEVLETEYEIKVLENPIGNITPPDSGGGGSSGGSW